MEDKQRIRLLGSHKILLQEKALRVQEVLRLLKVKQVEFQSAFKLIKEELGISQEELNKWKLSKDEEAIERIPEEKTQEKK